MTEPKEAPACTCDGVKWGAPGVEHRPECPRRVSGITDITVSETGRAS